MFIGSSYTSPSSAECPTPGNGGGDGGGEGGGEKGDKGEKGEKGDKGDSGDKGNKGEKGDKGNKGDDGDKGDKGNKGDKGESGSIGSSGFKGNKGNKGNKGDRGRVGDEGERGNKGNKGEKGEKGDHGRKGRKGEKGDPGVRKYVRNYYKPNKITKRSKHNFLFSSSFLKKVSLSPFFEDANSSPALFALFKNMDGKIFHFDVNSKDSIFFDESQLHRFRFGCNSDEKLLESKCETQVFRISSNKKQSCLSSFFKQDCHSKTKKSNCVKQIETKNNEKSISKLIFMNQKGEESYFVDPLCDLFEFDDLDASQLKKCGETCFSQNLEVFEEQKKESDSLSCVYNPFQMSFSSQNNQFSLDFQDHLVRVVQCESLCQSLSNQPDPIETSFESQLQKIDQFHIEKETLLEKEEQSIKEEYRRDNQLHLEKETEMQKELLETQSKQALFEQNEKKILEENEQLKEELELMKEKQNKMLEILKKITDQK